MIAPDGTDWAQFVAMGLLQTRLITQALVRSGYTVNQRIGPRELKGAALSVVVELQNGIYEVGVLGVDVALESIIAAVQRVDSEGWIGHIAAHAELVRDSDYLTMTVCAGGLGYWAVLHTGAACQVCYLDLHRRPLTRSFLRSLPDRPGKTIHEIERDLITELYTRQGWAPCSK